MTSVEWRRSSRVAAEYDGARRRPVDWFLLSGERPAVAAILLAPVAVVVWGVVVAGIAPLSVRTPLLYLLFALVSGNFTLVTIVVSISQFVLARHLESPGEIREGLNEIVGYRQTVGEITRERVLPVTPSGFLVHLFRSIDRDVRALRDREWTDDEAALREDVEALVEPLESHAEAIIDTTERSDAGHRYALFAVLDTNYSRYFYGAYRLRAAHGDDLPAAVAEDLDRLERHLEQVDVARRYFKTVLIQSDLATLSRHLLYIGLPVLVATIALMLLFTAQSGPAISRPVLRIVIPLVVTAGFAPIVLLTAYILRLTTVVGRTAAMYPFTTRED